MLLIVPREHKNRRVINANDAKCYLYLLYGGYLEQDLIRFLHKEMFTRSGFLLRFNFIKTQHYCLALCL